MKIYAPVKETNGIYASVLFVNGVGETDKPHLIEWFKRNGYRVEDEYVEPREKVVEDVPDINVEDIEPDFESMTPNDLRDWMREHGYAGKIRNIKNKEKLLEILRG